LRNQFDDQPGILDSHEYPRREQRHDGRLASVICFCSQRPRCVFYKEARAVTKSAFYSQDQNSLPIPWYSSRGDGNAVL